jgi:hypothetical protein
MWAASMKIRPDECRMPGVNATCLLLVKATPSKRLERNLHTLGFCHVYLQCRGSPCEPHNGAWFLQRYLRAAELEMRAAEEPLRSDLDVKGLKAQVLGRIEELEARERKGGTTLRAQPRNGGAGVRHGRHESDDERISLYPAFCIFMR